MIHNNYSQAVQLIQMLDNDLCDIIDVECVKEYIKVFGKVNRKDTYVRDQVDCDCSCLLF